ncbi:MAG: hypothetical protein R2824_32850 [Saprospiraceae bacterium]
MIPEKLLPCCWAPVALGYGAILTGAAIFYRTPRDGGGLRQHHATDRSAYQRISIFSNGSSAVLGSLVGSAGKKNIAPDGAFGFILMCIC